MVLGATGTKPLRWTYSSPVHRLYLTSGATEIRARGSRFPGPTVASPLITSRKPSNTVQPAGSAGSRLLKKALATPPLKRVTWAAWVTAGTPAARMLTASPTTNTNRFIIFLLPGLRQALLDDSVTGTRSHAACTVLAHA